MSKRHMVTLHHNITVYNNLFDHMDGIMRALPMTKTPWKKDWYLAMRIARQKLTTVYADVTPMTGMLLSSAYILEAFVKLRSFKKWDKGMDITLEDKTSYTTQYHEAVLKYAENEYDSQPRRVPVIIPEIVPRKNCYGFPLNSDDGTCDHRTNT